MSELPLLPRAEARESGPLRLFRGTLVVMAAIAMALLVWRLVDLLLILFACMIVALNVSRLAGFLKRRLKLHYSLAFIIAVVGPIAFIATAFALFGAAMSQQFDILVQSLPEALSEGQRMLESNELGRRLLVELPGLAPSAGSVATFLQSLLSDIGTVVSIVAVILVGGIYFAAQPSLYRRSILAFVPPRNRIRVSRTIKVSIGALNSWLNAQAVGMAFVAVATGIGLSFVGIPGAPAIGLVAGLCEFVPYLGTFVVALPAVLIGFSMGTETGIWTVVVLVVVQQIQGNLVSPMAQSQLADLPPALTIFTLIVFGVLTGPLGVILSVPLTVVGVALLKEVVIEERKRRRRAATRAAPASAA
jgi:predicted PurR-regulated permease PerM